MTDSTLELSKFQRKADAYRRALHVAPYARSVEVVPMLAYLKGLCQAIGVHRSRLKIVDFMSGDGHLSRILYGQGYRNIVAIESCNEMSFDSEIYEKVQLISAPDAVAGLRVIEHCNPQVVVSLAGFHHLIEMANDETVNLALSVELQSTVVAEAFTCAPSLLLFIIVDLSVASRGHWGLDRWHLWKGLSAKEAGRLDQVHSGKLKEVYEAESFGDFSGAVDRAFLTKHESTFSVPWFREVIDCSTEIGHKDAAISNEFIDELSARFAVNYRKYACPWHFDGDEQLGVFIQEKFGFSLGDGGKSPEEVRGIARDRHLVRGRDGMESFLWDLGIVVVERPGLEFKKKSIIDRFYLFPIGLVVFAMLYLLAKLYAPGSEAAGWIFNGVFVMIGGSIKMLLGEEAVTHR